jgi:hypothetical protein
MNLSHIKKPFSLFSERCLEGLFLSNPFPSKSLFTKLSHELIGVKSETNADVTPQVSAPGFGAEQIGKGLTAGK